MQAVTVQILVGDCLKVLDLLPDESVHSCVTDPPYHLTSIVKRFGKPGSAPANDGDVYARSSRGFMGKEWDGGDIAFRPDVWREVLRVLKPGGHLLAFGGTRGFHRMFCAIEDAGFEIRDCVSWLYGSGFPKSHDAGDGWGTALKPAWEPVCVARKPLIGTVADNVEAFGTGAINIDGCRVGTEQRTYHGMSSWMLTQKLEDRANGGTGIGYADGSGKDYSKTVNGRWPANVIHDGSDDVLETFPDAIGQIADASSSSSRKTQNVYGAMKRGSAKAGPEGSDFAMKPGARRGDSGSAARFFYCAKASKSDREDGCEGLPMREGGTRSETSGQHITRRDGGDPAPVRNNHPTVKPTELMRYLCRLVTPPGGTVLDPFMGSGSTGRGAVLEGFNFIGIEREPDYAAIARARIAAVDIFAE